MHNPFTITFGKSPLQYVPRPLQFNEITESFQADYMSQQVYVITGVRGSGKTVLLTDIEKYFQKEKGWSVIRLNPELDLLEGLMSKLHSHPNCSDILRSADIDLSFFGIGIHVNNAAQISDPETAIVRMLEHLKKHDRRVLITIDEVTNNEHMRVFAGSFQSFVRQDLPVCLLMTGLYENIDNLQNEKNLTFLYRAPKIPLKPLNLQAICQKYMDVFQIDKTEASQMADLTQGYSFAFQALGYLVWENGTPFHSSITEYGQYLADFVYEKIWSELSRKDREIAYAIASTNTSDIKSIREYLHMETNQFNPYRKRLIKKGVINGEPRGHITFALPLFRDFVLSEYPMSDPF